jgi:hypothetical protein
MPAVNEDACCPVYHVSVPSTVDEFVLTRKEPEMSYQQQSGSEMR